MSKTGKSQTSVQSGGEPGTSLLARDDELASTVSAYLDGELTGQALADFEALLDANEALSREVAQMQWINRQLREIGADILNEQIPGSMLVPLSRLRTRDN